MAAGARHPVRPITTLGAEEAAALDAKHHLVLNVPQVVFGDPGLVLRLFAEPTRLRAIPVAPPPYWELKDLLKAAFAP